jgi:hypothetical protein
MMDKVLKITESKAIKRVTSAWKYVVKITILILIAIS